MAIEFRCTQCYTLLRTKDEAAGRQLSCPKCGQALQVPAPETPVASPPPPPTEAEPGGIQTPPPLPGAEPGGMKTPPPPGEVNPYQAPASTEAAWQQPTATRSGLAIASLVLGIVSLPTFCCCAMVGLPISLTGLVMGIAAIRSTDRGMAIAGIVLNSIGLLLFLLYVAFFVFSIFAQNAPMGF